MSRLNRLAEARIREWQNKQPQRRVRKGSAEAAAAQADEPLEVALLRQIEELHAKARSTTAPESEALSKRARELETQLLVLLETTGRPLAAQHLAERLSKKSR